MKLNFKPFSAFFSHNLWTLPFLACCAGYVCLQFFLHDTIVTTPHFIGKNLLYAAKVSSDLKLNLRIIAEKEVADAVPGTIIKQNPLPNSCIKAHQSIFIAITKLPEPKKAPDLIGKTQQEIEKICKDNNIKNRIYFIPSYYPTQQCFAQMPQAGEYLEDKKMSCYVSTTCHNQLLFPDLTHKKLSEILDFLHTHHITYDIYHKNQKINQPFSPHLVINYQKPLAGTIITADQKLYVQLQVA